MKTIRNVVAVPIGITLFIGAEYLLTLILKFVLSIPVISALISSYVSLNVFIASTAPIGSVFIAKFVVDTVSIYNKQNYSGIVVFSVLALFYLIIYINTVVNNGFNFSDLWCSIIKIGSVCIALGAAVEGEEI